MNLDLRKGWSSGSGDRALTNGLMHGGNETGACEPLKISAWECGNDNGADLWSGFDLWAVGLHPGFCKVEGGVWIDGFEVLGVSEAQPAGGLLLEDETVQKVTQTVRILMVLTGKCL